MTAVREAILAWDCGCAVRSDGLHPCAPHEAQWNEAVRQYDANHPDDCCTDTCGCVSSDETARTYVDLLGDDEGAP